MPVYLGKTLLTAKEIEAKVEELGSAISSDYEGKDLLLINVLKGGVIFLSDLIRKITIPLSLDFMAISSYGTTNTSGVVKIVKDLEESIGGKHVLVVEDIVDTGLTLGYLIKNINSRNPASLKICSLLDRSVRRIVDMVIDYKGFEIPDVFVLGYGLDYGQRYRNLPYIAVLEITEEKADLEKLKGAY